jgi:hypothetical protein
MHGTVDGTVDSTVISQPFHAQPFHVQPVHVQPFHVQHKTVRIANPLPPFTPPALTPSAPTFVSWSGATH